LGGNVLSSLIGAATFTALDFLPQADGGGGAATALAEEAELGVHAGADAFNCKNNKERKEEKLLVRWLSHWRMQ